jgi:hypothetical protein
MGNPGQDVCYEKIMNFEFSLEIAQIQEYQSVTVMI